MLEEIVVFMKLLVCILFSSSLLLLIISELGSVAIRTFLLWRWILELRVLFVIIVSDVLVGLSEVVGTLVS